MINRQIDQFRELVNEVVSNDLLHARFLNSLSLMENTGARKIAAYEHPTKVDIMILKHAAEEFRHAFFLKKQQEKLSTGVLPDYADDHVLAALMSRHYLHRLDVQMCKLLQKERGYSLEHAKHGAYILVTYAIEVRADMLYGLYQEALTASGSRVNVKSIIAEEEGHLEEMTLLLEELGADHASLVEQACAVEDQLFNEWLFAMQKEVRATTPTLSE